ncbi:MULTISPECIES: HipA domain-containing protein [Mycobacterium]|nr:MULTISPECIES: HipA domain-containing protein [Mycobacterium]MCG7607968.1 HipA domain-containing protein [Mycobacterium sp. CnD-18-1]
MIDRLGRISLAPLYDAAPTAYLDSKYKGTGHVINGKTAIDVVDVDDLAREGASWGMSERRACSIVQSCMETVHDAIHSAPLPPGTERVKHNLEAMWVRRAWSIGRGTDTYLGES